MQALRGVDLDLFAGEFVVLLGPSGSGKSTLLNILGGLDTPSAGTVRYLDQDLTSFDDATLTQYRRTHVGFVFQSFQLVPHLNALENVMLPLEIRGDPLAKSRIAAAACLAKVGLSERLSHYPKTLSGGEQQRVALARAFVSEPNILFADEPTGSRDNNFHVVRLRKKLRNNDRYRCDNGIWPKQQTGLDSKCRLVVEPL